ncbi:MAG: cyclic nucleotide-binding domain-containing protein [Alkalinema sp. RL_2_19]|nr:cyclic nucleotide-binding domain-containing protein [Alkalinema sp. RL_2_19]
MKKILFILGELADTDLDWLLYVGRKERLVTGTTLIQEGFPVDTLYIVLTGRLSVTIDTIGKEIATLDSGEVVGEISFLDARPPVATVRAVTNSLVFSIPRKQLQHKLDGDGAFAARFYRAIALLWPIACGILSHYWAMVRISNLPHPSKSPGISVPPLSNIYPWHGSASKP